MRTLILALAVWAAATAAGAQTLSIQGRDGRTAAFTTAEFAALPHVAVTAVQHERTYSYEGVPLEVLLARVGIAFDKPLSGRDLAAALRATGADGFQVVLALSEADPATRKARVVVADRQDGKPLGAGLGPFRLVVADDLRPARSARQLARIEVVDLATASKAAP